MAVRLDQHAELPAAVLQRDDVPNAFTRVHRVFEHQRVVRRIAIEHNQPILLRVPRDEQ